MRVTKLLEFGTIARYFRYLLSEVIKMFNYIETEDLVEMLVKDNSKISIIDVRDEDEFLESHIKGAINCPSHLWNEESGYIDKFIQNYVVGSPKEILVFHCFKSMVRGPTCAGMLQEQLSSMSDEKELPQMLV